MEKGLLFLTISVGCLWIILDEFFGTQKISGLSQKLTPDINTPIDKAIDSVKDTVDNFTKWETKTDGEKEKKRQEINKNIDSNKNIKDDKAKNALKDAVNKFYGRDEA